jgi:crotonobetainyl-CoA:carnitine CoA-transferase CaiB-like acyl-CoA transferase
LERSAHVGGTLPLRVVLCTPGYTRSVALGGDARLSVLCSLLDRAEPSEHSRILKAIRRRRRELEHAVAVDALAATSVSAQHPVAADVVG